MKNIVIEIDGLRHKLTQNYSTCDKCSLKELCDTYSFTALCNNFYNYDNTIFELEK